MAKTTCFGIDLGTTYSAMSFINDMGRAEIIEHGGKSIIPSIVYFGSGGTVVGDDARDKGKDGGEEAQRVVSFAKRNMPFPQPGEDEFEVRGEKFTKKWEFDGVEYSPVDVSAEVLKHLKSNAEASMQATIETVVITCPAFFDDIARRRTKAAAVKGLGLEEKDIRIVEEPVAAALNYALETGEDIKGKTFLVYDLGGGTFDITVLTVNDESGKTVYKVIRTEGNHYLGGGNWDDKIVEFFKEKFFEETGIQFSLDHADDADDFYEEDFNLRADAEKRKQNLTNGDSITQTIKFNGQRARVELTREKFDELTSGLLNDTFLLTDTVIEYAKQNGVQHFDAFLLVGGSTYMRQVPEGLLRRYANEKALSGITPIYHEPDKAVAKGAAKQAEMWLAHSVLDEIAPHSTDVPPTQKQLEDGASKMGVTVSQFKTLIDTKVGNVCSESFGIQAYQNDTPKIFNLIRRGADRPVTGKSDFVARGCHPEIIIYGNLSMDDSLPVSEGVVRPQQGYGYPELSEGQDIPVEVELVMSAEGLFDLYVTDLRDGSRQHVTLENEKKN